MRFRYLTDAMDHIVIKYQASYVVCEHCRKWTGLMVKDMKMLLLKEFKPTERYLVVTKCCEEEYEREES